MKMQLCRVFVETDLDGHPSFYAEKTHQTRQGEKKFLIYHSVEVSRFRQYWFEQNQKPETTEAEKQAANAEVEQDLADNYYWQLY